MEKDFQRAMDCIRKIESEPRRINTTLYDLVEAVIDEVGSRDSRLVTFVVLHLLGQEMPSTSIH